MSPDGALLSGSSRRGRLDLERSAVAVMDKNQHDYIHLETGTSSTGNDVGFATNIHPGLAREPWAQILIPFSCSVHERYRFDRSVIWGFLLVILTSSPIIVVGPPRTAPRWVRSAILLPFRRRTPSQVPL